MQKPTMPAIGLALAFAVWRAAAESPPPVQPPPPAEVRIGFVDVSVITENAIFVRELRERIEGEYEARYELFQARREEYAILLNEIERQDSLLSDEAKSAKVQKAVLLNYQLEVDRRALDKFVQDSEEEKAPALARIHQVVREVAEAEGCDIVLERTQLIYGRASVDLSDKVIARLNGAPD
jgi:Skp family chaperone for outer membrane proteins